MAIPVNRSGCLAVLSIPTERLASNGNPCAYYTSIIALPVRPSGNAKLVPEEAVLINDCISGVCMRNDTLADAGSYF